MRYLKAWRDYQNWKGDDPKSILLMVMADEAFEKPVLGRHDLALRAVVRAMITMIDQPVLAPWDGTCDLMERYDAESKSEFRMNLIALEKKLTKGHRWQQCN